MAHRLTAGHPFQCCQDSLPGHVVQPRRVLYGPAEALALRWQLRARTGVHCCVHLGELARQAVQAPRLVSDGIERWPVFQQLVILYARSVR
jgi:hypothetical protein